MKATAGGYHEGDAKEAKRCERFEQARQPVQTFSRPNTECDCRRDSEKTRQSPPTGAWVLWVYRYQACARRRGAREEVAERAGFEPAVPLRVHILDAPTRGARRCAPAPAVFPNAVLARAFAAASTTHQPVGARCARRGKTSAPTPRRARWQPNTPLDSAPQSSGQSASSVPSSQSALPSQMRQPRNRVPSSHSMTS